MMSSSSNPASHDHRNNVLMILASRIAAEQLIDGDRNNVCNVASQLLLVTLLLYLNVINELTLCS